MPVSAWAGRAPRAIRADRVRPHPIDRRLVDHRLVRPDLRRHPSDRSNEIRVSQCGPAGQRSTWLVVQNVRQQIAQLFLGDRPRAAPRRRCHFEQAEVVAQRQLGIRQDRARGGQHGDRMTRALRVLPTLGQHPRMGVRDDLSSPGLPAPAHRGTPPSHDRAGAARSTPGGIHGTRRHYASPYGAERRATLSGRRCR